LQLIPKKLISTRGLFSMLNLGAEGAIPAGSQFHRGLWGEHGLFERGDDVLTSVQQTYSQASDQKPSILDG